VENSPTATVMTATAMTDSSRVTPARLLLELYCGVFNEREGDERVPDDPGTPRGRLAP